MIQETSINIKHIALVWYNTNTKQYSIHKNHTTSHTYLINIYASSLTIYLQHCLAQIYVILQLYLSTSQHLLYQPHCDIQAINRCCCGCCVSDCWYRRITLYTIYCIALRWRVLHCFVVIAVMWSWTVCYVRFASLQLRLVVLMGKRTITLIRHITQQSQFRNTIQVHIVSQYIPQYKTHYTTQLTAERDNIPYHIAANMIRHRLQAHLMNWIGADLQQGTIRKQQSLLWATLTAIIKTQIHKHTNCIPWWDPC